MRDISNKPRYDSIGEAFRQGGNIGYDAKNDAKVAEARQINLIQVMRAYGVDITEHSKKICCPFPNHNDNSPSFIFYKSTNSFYCWGCLASGGAPEFVASMEGISKSAAYEKLLSKFEPDMDSVEIANSNFYDKQRYMIQFSNMIRNFILNNHDDMDAFAHADKISLVFDSISQKHSLDVEGYQSVIQRLKAQLEKWPQ